MDSLSSSDASARDEDSVVLSVTSALAKDALSYFQSAKFAECIDILNQLNHKKPHDPKVLHNMAIAEYIRDGCSNAKELLEALNYVKKQSEELAAAAKEQGEAATPGTNVSVSKDQFDSSVSILNMAVTWFHLHEYTKSLSILQPLYQNILRLDETIVHQICFLLLDSALACRDAVKFLTVFGYMEKTFGVGLGSQEENGSTMQLSSNQVSKTSSLLSSSVVSDTLKSDLTAVESSLCEENLDYDNVLAEIEAEKRMKHVGHIPTNNLLKTLGERSILSVDLKLELQLYKVRFLLLTRNLKLAKREVKHAMNIAQKRDSSMALLLKSQLEYALGNHRKAIKLLLVSGIQKDAGTSGIFNNNLGCIYYQLGKYQTSATLFSKALRDGTSLRKEKPVKLFSLSQDKSLLITYNLGILYLACGKPLLAARCFQEASLVFYRQPLIWLRIAECCTMAHQKGLLEEGITSSDRSEMRVHVIGKGKWRKLMMEENGSVELAGSAKWPKLSLALARVCLSNGLYLLSGLNDSKSDLQSTLPLDIDETKEASSSDHGEANTNSDLKEAKGGMNQAIIQSSLSAFKDIKTRENQFAKQALFANMAYVELELENPIKALSAANSLLQLPDCSKIYAFLGHLYAAEALCLLNRPVDAGAHLSAYLLGQDDFNMPFGQEDFDQWRMNVSYDCEETWDSSTGNARDSVFLKPEESRGTLFADLAALLATQGHYDQAKPLIAHALSILQNNVEATVTAIYIDLMLGSSQDALARLKQCTRVSFVPGTLEVRR
ncbi:hypothetical protein AALP_AAs57819U000100 [Arabis alpina]|uniref:CCR4-NOT transcription complex subunit 10 n=1 Tax=Arabis alpina TaxID=50452 RepID=A0A087FXK8_ARAAL|nr:hypothetical protein AALP_AAs57819U000100 [Arabis alpina]